MTAHPTAPADAPAPAALSPQAAQLLQELAGLLESAPAPGDFYPAFLQRVLTAFEAAAGAVWGLTAQGHFKLQYQINLAEVGLDQIPGARACHAEVLRRAARRDRPLWVPPRGGAEVPKGEAGPVNLTHFGLLLVPVVVDGQAVGLVELWKEPHRATPPGRNTARLAAEVAGFAAAYLHKDQYRQLLEQQRRAARQDAFARQVHGSLDPREVAFQAANQGRQLLECDQVAVAVRWGKTVRLEAISGAPAVEKRSRLVQAMTALCDAVLAWGEMLVYAGTRDPALPPAVARALDTYLAESNSQLLVLVPLRDEREQARPCRCALLVESFDPAFALDRLDGRLEGLAGHVAAALYNAVEHRRLPLRWLTQPLARLQDGLNARGRVKAGVVLGILVALASALLFIRVPLRMDARGQLLPRDRQVVFATFNGKIIEMKARHGDQVEKDQELLFMEDLETQLKIEQLGVKAHAARQRLALLGEQINRAAAGEERDALTRERINQEYELRKAQVERDILLQESRNPRKAPVRAPQAGKVITFDPREQLVGKTVKPGDPLLRIARVQGPWEIELSIPEGNVGPIRQALRDGPADGLQVDLLLSSQPNRTYRGRLRRDGLGGETVVKDGAVVLPARVRIADPSLREQLATMPAGVEVRAKIHCGDRSLGCVWFFDLAEFFYEHVWF